MMLRSEEASIPRDRNDFGPISTAFANASKISWALVFFLLRRSLRALPWCANGSFHIHKKWQPPSGMLKDSLRYSRGCFPLLLRLLASRLGSFFWRPGRNLRDPLCEQTKTHPPWAPSQGGVPSMKSVADLFLKNATAKNAHTSAIISHSRIDKQTILASKTKGRTL